MKLIGEVLTMVKIADLEAEVQERVNLANQMVGTLYPSILSDEIGMIYERIRALAEQD